MHYCIVKIMFKHIFTYHYSSYISCRTRACRQLSDSLAITELLRPTRSSLQTLFALQPQHQTLFRKKNNLCWSGVLQPIFLNEPMAVFIFFNTDLVYISAINVLYKYVNKVCSTLSLLFFDNSSHLV